MSLRPFRLPADLRLMMEILPQSFQYPENPEWSLQDDELQSFLSMANTARRLWPIFSVLWKISPSLSDVLHGFIWEENAKPVGIVNISREGTSDDWLISNVAVLPAYRRRGIARKLVEAAVDLAHEHHAKHVLLDVIAGNSPAYELYTTLGFTHFESALELRHDAPSPAASFPIPNGYTVTRCAPNQWQPFYELARRITPAEVEKFRPVTTQHFRNPASMQLVISLINTFSGVHDRGLVIRADSGREIVATARLSAHTRGSGMNFCAVMLDPEHSKLAPYLFKSTLGTLQQLSPHNRIQCQVPTWQPALIEAAQSSGFREHTEGHSLGMEL